MNDRFLDSILPWFVSPIATETILYVMELASRLVANGCYFN